MTPSKSLPPPTMSVECPSCGERLVVRREHAGRKGQCTSCSRVFRIGAAPTPGVYATAAVPAPPRPAPPPEAPPIFTFACSLCDTRITVRTADVGKRIECPDCGRKNLIPPPPTPKAKVAPAAFSGEQLEVWGLDEYRSGVEPPAKSRLHPVECRLCQTLMYATEEQVGTKIQCPDCGSFTLAERSKPARPEGVQPVLPGLEYQLDPASAPTPRPVAMSAALRDAEFRSAGRRAAELAVSGKAPPLRDELPKPRPKLPAAPLITGVHRMLLTAEVLAHWMFLSLLATAVGFCVMEVITAPGGGLAGFVGVMFSVATMVLGALWITWAAPLCLAIVAESSEGHDQLHQPPSWLSFDWLGETLYLITAVGACGFPAALLPLLGDVVPLPVQGALFAAVFVFCFPLALLSELNEGSPFAVVSPRVFRSLGQCAGQWLSFYVQSALVLAVAAAAAWALPAPALRGILPLALIAVATLLTYMRLLGRLAWWLSEKMPAADEPQREFSRYRTEIEPRFGESNEPPAKR